MSDKAWENSGDYDQPTALQQLESVLSGYELPDNFNQSLIRPWMDIANALLELYGEQSDAWRRMIWFTRIVCNAISTSLERRDPEPLEQALNTFMTWLRVCSQETSSLDLAFVAAEYLCRRLKMEITVDLAADDLRNETETASAPVIAAPYTEPELLHETENHLEEERPPAGAEAPGHEHQEILENANPFNTLLKDEPGPAMTPDLPEHYSFQEPSAPMSLDASIDELEEQPADTARVDQDIPGKPIITMNAGNTIMDIPTLSERYHTPRGDEPGLTTAADTTHFSQQPGAERPKSIPVPIGVWLGFHDQDMSTMAKLAVYDRANDNYIFANKQGFLVRQINTPDLLHLIENELVDIIERRLVSRKPTA